MVVFSGELYETRISFSTSFCYMYSCGGGPCLRKEWNTYCVCCYSNEFEIDMTATPAFGMVTFHLHA